MDGCGAQEDTIVAGRESRGRRPEGFGRIDLMLMGRIQLRELFTLEQNAQYCLICKISLPHQESHPSGV